jgi:hypothetical protein
MGAKNNSQVTVNVDIRAGWVIDISPKDRPPHPGDVIVSSEAVDLPVQAASDE